MKLRYPVSTHVVESSEPEKLPLTSVGSEWWFAGSCELAGLCTCKGRKLKAGVEVTFSFPLNKSNSPLVSKVPGRGQSPSSSPEIVRFSTQVLERLVVFQMSGCIVFCPL